MFAQSFDNIKRKMLKADPPVLLHAVETLQRNSPNFMGFMALFLDPANDTLDLWIEDDASTYTFYTTVRDARLIERMLQREKEEANGNRV